MKTTVLSLFATLLICNFAHAQTTVPGGNVSGTWTLAGSPYLVQGSVMVPGNQTLTIEPGVKVVFQGTFKLLVIGRLLAIGTATDSITFTAADTAAGWRSIRFDGTSAASDTSKFIYCRLEYGKATGVPPDDDGGAFYFDGFSRAVIARCTITRCRADEAGGGIYMINSSPVIRENVLSHNLGVNVGGGICCHVNSNPEISRNTIIFNTTFYNGGSGISCVSGNPVITGNIIAWNTNDTYSGGGIWCNGSDALISGNTISNNSAPFGGGINTSGGNPTIINNTITNNTGGDGGGILCTASNPVVTNNTIANNSAARGGAIGCQMASGPTLRNNILWGNHASAAGQQVNIADEGSDPNFYYCDVAGGAAAFELNFTIFTGTYQNNIDSLPDFVAPTEGTGTGFPGVTADWSLQDWSPCINAGDPTGSYPATDKAGNPRVAEGRIDIGAYEYQWALGTEPGTDRKAVRVYPNPTREYIIIENSPNSVAEIITGDGEILRKEFIAGRKATLFLGNLADGLYCIKLKSDHEVEVKVFVIR